MKALKTEIEISAFLLLIDKPSQPGEIDIISITKDCITIHWLRPEQDGGKEILGYWIEFRQAGESAWKKCNQERSKDRQFTMGGLMEATEYEFRIIAENETGLSRPRRTPMGIKTKLSGERCSGMAMNHQHVFMLAEHKCYRLWIQAQPIWDVTRQSYRYCIRKAI